MAICNTVVVSLHPHEDIVRILLKLNTVQRVIFKGVFIFAVFAISNPTQNQHTHASKSHRYHGRVCRKEQNS